MSLKRSIIEINQSKCNGCGKCIPNCPEGALQIIDGKAHLVSDLFCDGLGACIGECPLGAIRTVEREAAPYDEEKVMENIVKQGSGTIAAHLKHLKDHGEFKLHEIALSYLKKNNIPLPETKPVVCPGSLGKILYPEPEKQVSASSALRQWPVQLKLINPASSFFDDCELLISADCVAHACGVFHSQLLSGKKLIIFCPKLDTDIDGYVDKLAEIFSRHPIRRITVARMTVPCCGGTVRIVEKAREKAGIDAPVQVQIVELNGILQN